jgi:hypothetical protein
MGNKIGKTTKIFDKVETLKTWGSLIGMKGISHWLSR